MMVANAQRVYCIGSVILPIIGTECDSALCISRARTSNIASIFRSICMKWILARFRSNSTPTRPMATSPFVRLWFAANPWSDRMSGATQHRFQQLVRRRTSHPGSSLIILRHLYLWRPLTSSGIGEARVPACLTLKSFIAAIEPIPFNSVPPHVEESHG